MNIRTLFLVIYVSLPMFCLSMDMSLIGHVKRGLYYSQQGFLKKDKFDEFIEPYLEEMERSLFLFKYHKQHSEEEWLVARGYFLDVIECFIDCFCDYVHGKNVTRKGIGFESTDFLRRRIIHWLDVLGFQAYIWQEEYQKTSDILHRMAVAYYEALPRRKKFKVWWLKSINRLEYGVFFRQPQYY